MFFSTSCGEIVSAVKKHICGKELFSSSRLDPAFGCSLSWVYCPSSLCGSSSGGASRPVV